MSRNGVWRCRLFGHRRRIKVGAALMPMPSWWTPNVGPFRVVCKRCEKRLGWFPPPRRT